MLYIEAPGISLDLSGGYLYRFSAVPALLYTATPQSAAAYVPSSTEAEAALKEYRDWAGQFGQPEVPDLTSLLSDVERHRTYLLERLSLEADKFEASLNKDMYFTSSLGFRVNGDRRTKSNLSDLITYFDYQSVSGFVEYRDYDNVTRKLTKQQLTTLLGELVLNGQALYQQKWSIQDLISRASTFDDLHAVKIDFHMTDYSKGAV